MDSAAGPVAELAWPVYRPKTVDELVDAIGPERIIELDPSVTYRLDQAQRGVSDNYRWANPLREEYELIIRDCPSLTIRSAGPGKARLYTRFAYAYVLAFEHCDALKLENLELGHAPDPGYCLGGVVRIKHSADVSITGSRLFGCGTDGLALTGVRGFLFKDASIDGCTYGIMTAKDCRDLAFVDSAFHGNREYYGFTFSDTIGIRFKGCAVYDNTVDTRMTGGLFVTNLNKPEGRIVFEGGRIEGNRARRLVQPMQILQASGTRIGGNAFAGAAQPD